MRQLFIQRAILLLEKIDNTKVKLFENIAFESYNVTDFERIKNRRRFFKIS